VKNMRNKLSSYNIYILFSAASALFFSLIFTVNIVYQVEIIHLNPLQLILVGTTLEMACFLFEIPTGIVADIYSRKLSVIIGLSLIGLGFTIEGAIPQFTAVIIAQIFWGVGYTFISGALDAWIAEEDKYISLDSIYMKGAQVGQIGSVIGIALSTILANFSIRLPILLSGILFILFALFLIVYMPEYNFKSSAPKDLNTFEKMSHTLKSSLGFIKSKKIIMFLLSITLFYGLSSEGYDRLSTAHFLQDTTLPSIGGLESVTWFGIFGIAGMLLNALVMQLNMKIFEEKGKNKKIFLLLTINTFFILSMIVFALTKNFTIMLVFFLSTNMLRTVNEPLFNAWLNSNIDDNARATVLSTNGQLNALGQIIGGPIIGIIATKFSISTGIACTALLLSPVLLLYMLSIRKDKKIHQIIKIE
jgi:MFS transporter, DHA3 family, tetracycline resistance protein